METICAGCGKEIHQNHPRLSGEHGTVCMGCEFATIPVFKLSCNGGCYADRDIRGIKTLIENMEIDDEYTVRRVEMPLTKYLSLPEFQGF